MYCCCFVFWFCVCFVFGFGSYSYSPVGGSAACKRHDHKRNQKGKETGRVAWLLAIPDTDTQPAKAKAPEDEDEDRDLGTVIRTEEPGAKGPHARYTWRDTKAGSEGAAQERHGHGQGSASW